MIKNVVMEANKATLWKLCSISYGHLPYAGNLISYSLATYVKKIHSVKKVLIKIPGTGKFFVYARDCIMYFLERSGSMSYIVKTLDYKLSPGHDIDSMLLLKTSKDSAAVDGVEECDVLETIVNVHPKYIDLLF